MNALYCLKLEAFFFFSAFVCNLLNLADAFPVLISLAKFIRLL